jgi:Arc/MetJ-type ribon-helix-helix transcriptional regulator
MALADKPSEMVTLKIPRPLYERLQQLIDGTGFRSVTEFATYVLRDLASHPQARVAPQAKVARQAERRGREELAPRMTEAELEEARRRLRELGYL